MNNIYNFDDDLLEKIRLNWGWWIFNGDVEAIVPKEFMHRHLIDNFSVSDGIEKYYYSPCRDMFTDEDYENFKSTGYVGNPETTLEPYPFSYKGAFIQRKQLYFRIRHLMYSPENYKGNPIKTLIDLFPYFEEYAQGFKVGFDLFEDDCIKKYLPMFADKSDFINKIFEYVTKHVIFTHSWKNNHNGFTVSHNVHQNLNSPGEIIKAFEDGKYQGYFYKAWTIILSNANLFESLFANLSNPVPSEPELIDNIVDAAHTMQQNKVFWNADEDKKTRQLLDLLSTKYQTKDQSKYGKSHAGKKAGSVDGVIKYNNIEVFLEAFALKSLNRNIIKAHIDKLEQNYDSKGLKEKVLVIYYNLPINKFADAAKKYLTYLKDEHQFAYPLEKLMKSMSITQIADY